MAGRTAAALLLCAATLAGGCDGIRRDAATGVAEGRRLTAAEIGRQRAVQRGEIIREERPFYGAAVEAERGSRSGDPLPAAVDGARGFRIALAGQADVRTVAEAVTAATGIPVNIRTRYVLGSGVVDVPIGTRMAARFEGPLSAFLDRLGSRMDVAWSYDGRAITIDRMVRRTWRVPLPFGATDISDSAATEAGAIVSTTRSLDPWAELGDRLLPLAPPPAQISLSPQTGRVEVLGPPSVIDSVTRVLEDVVTTASVRIGLEIGVYFVDTDRADSFGVALDLEARAGDLTASLAAAATGAAAGSLVIGRPGTRESAIDFRALARDSAVVDYRLASTVAQSGVISPIALTRETRYIERITTVTAENGTNTTAYEPGEFETGLSISALPRLVDRRRVQLALTLTQRELVDFLRRGGTTGAIGLPSIENRSIRNESVLVPGETLVLSGYESERSERGNQGIGFLRLLGIGGSSEARRRKVRMVVLVRPTLIPAGRA